MPAKYKKSQHLSQSLILPQMTTKQQTTKRAAPDSGADNNPKMAKTKSDAKEQQNTTSPSSGGAAGSGGTDADKCKQSILMISDTPPFRPRMPTQEEITSGAAPSVRSYIQKLKKVGFLSFLGFPLHGSGGEVAPSTVCIYLPKN